MSFSQAVDGTRRDSDSLMNFPIPSRTSASIFPIGCTRPGHVLPSDVTCNPCDHLPWHHICPKDISLSVVVRTYRDTLYKCILGAVFQEQQFCGVYKFWEDLKKEDEKHQRFLQSLLELEFVDVIQSLYAWWMLQILECMCVCISSVFINPCDPGVTLTSWLNPTFHQVYV